MSSICVRHHSALGPDTLDAYLMTGGLPRACGHIAQGRLPEYLIELVMDWVYGVSASAGRMRGALLAVMESLLRFWGTPVGQAKLARESGLGNNTVAAGYIDLLSDLMCVTSSYAWDAQRNVKIRLPRWHGIQQSCERWQDISSDVIEGQTSP